MGGFFKERLKKIVKKELGEADLLQMSDEELKEREQEHSASGYIAQEILRTKARYRKKSDEALIVLLKSPIPMENTLAKQILEERSKAAQPESE